MTVASVLLVITTLLAMVYYYDWELRLYLLRFCYYLAFWTVHFGLVSSSRYKC